MSPFYTYSFANYQVVQTPCLWKTHQNYNYTVHTQGRAVLIDPGEATPILQTLKSLQLQPEAILLTHHHPDHVGAVTQLTQKFSCPVWGFEGDRHRLPSLTHTFRDGEALSHLGLTWTAVHKPGHTLGLCVFYVPEMKWLFANDLLFSLGCGRLFEGSPQQMWSSLQSLRNLPPDTWVFSSHEYTERNLAFCQAILPKDPALQTYATWVHQQRDQNLPTTPFRLDEEIARNPFFRGQEGAIQEQLGLSLAGLTPDQMELATFTELRRRRDAF